jgi:hypothetical protein
VVCPTAKIAPTETTCAQYKAGTAATLSTVNYSVSGGKISGTNPGVFFYFMQLNAPSASFDITVTQSTNSSSGSLFHVLNDSAGQVNLFDANCNSSSLGTVTSTSPNAVTIHVTGATAGQLLIVAVKYQTKSLIDTNAPSPANPTYTFATKLGTTTIIGSAQGLTLTLQ